MSWKEVAEAFCVTWDHVYVSVKHAVTWGKVHRDLCNIESIGVDEVQWQRGHKYQTLVYQIDSSCKRLLWIGPDRTAKTLFRFFRFLGKERTSRLQFICSDMWQGYVKVIAKKAPHAIHVLDRFHVMQKMSKALDQVRATEVKQLQADGYEPILKGSRWLLLKRPENLSENQAIKLKDLTSIQSQVRTKSFDEGGLPTLLEVPIPGWGRKVPRCMVHTRHAKQNRTDEEDGQDTAQETGLTAELVPR